jgi:hypothetical protein
MLADSDARAGEELDREARELRALFGGGEAFSRFAALVSGYDFDGALAALRRAASEKGV